MVQDSPDGRKKFGAKSDFFQNDCLEHVLAKNSSNQFCQPGAKSSSSLAVNKKRGSGEACSISRPVRSFAIGANNILDNKNGPAFCFKLDCHCEMLDSANTGLKKKPNKGGKLQLRKVKNSKMISGIIFFVCLATSQISFCVGGEFKAKILE